MSSFECPVVNVSIEDHPNADRLDVAVVGGWRVVVASGAFSDGDAAVYVPEASILPDSLIAELGLEGRLAGPRHNRVKALRLRGELSQGLLVSLESPHLEGAAVEMGADCAQRLGITKWTPPVPAQMTGKAHPCTWPAKFDVDAWQKQPDAFTAGDPVQITEKLHGTFCLLGFHHLEGVAVTSKSMAGKLSFDPESPDNERNLYVRAWRQHGEKIVALAKRLDASVEVLGEIVGPRVQDLHYELSSPAFFGFDVLVDGALLSTSEASAALEESQIPSVPVVSASTPFNHDEALRAAEQPSLVGGGLREGVVVRSTEPRRNPAFGRLIAKYINPAYLLRRGGTDYN